MKAIFATLIVVGLTMGCANNKKNTDTASLSPAVTDISPTPAPAAYTPPAAQQPAQPVIADTTQAPAAATAGGKYTVKKGDTLWSIAATHYGNGNQWQKIASANPGLTASTLKAGQKIVIP